jgi:hypothetical protein
VKSVFWTWVVVLLVVAFVDPPSACAYDATELVAPPGKAAIVFIQNQKVDRGMTFTVFESDKRCVAEVGGREAQVLPVEPAPLIFYVIGYYTTRRIEIYPKVGRTYFVRLHTVDKPMGPAPEVTLVRRASEEHKLLKFHLEGAFVTRSIGDDKCYGKPLNERKNRTQRRINEGNADWKSGDDVYRDKYMLIENDGLTARDIALF